ncbi:luciferase family oxidoreductase, group 1 [Thiohalospira halophila DSM 15071]|uniref:Luciferase-like monooxygenase n=1 Tax=Thiohalospira halophila DSM 15071 TaxID=1123397 RepID=A0A1I1UK49_9GAMM|nr:LLM class flavin-dependent oxidoreductase [Thiohalospira halophila]SFD70975.1 luciferase family oxidoreductase, group 1 [Thiohalospira halophila DSM 15071]
MVPLSLLDLAPIRQGSDAAAAYRATTELAQVAEASGYRRFWLAEHHNMTGIGSSATAVLIGHVAEHTDSIRVGSGGVMLPNHAPLVVAEQFGTLESLHPGRIDLGLGRAPGSGQRTVRALRRGSVEGAERFAEDLEELRGYLRPLDGWRPVQAVPGTGLDIPVWVLGSSPASAGLAASLGLPYAFAAHFAPAELFTALARYRDEFQPSETLAEPYAMVAMNAVVAETDAEARYYFSSVEQQFLGMARGRTPGPMPPPVEDMDALWEPDERDRIRAWLTASVVGSPETARQQFADFLTKTAADEIMVTAQTFDPAVTLETVRRLATIRDAG